MIDSVKFGEITVEGRKYFHDIVIYPSGKVERRKKEISKRKHGTSHKFDPEELREYLKEDFDVLIVGTGIYGALKLLPDAREIVRDKKLIEKPTPEAIRLFNELRKDKKVLGVFHITC